MPHSHPDAGTILEVTIAYLEDDLYPKLTGVDRYHSRVTINALRIVQRELARGLAADAADQAELRALLDAPAHATALDDQLAREIREGRRPIDDDPLRGYLKNTLRRALEINNPKWLA